MTLAACRPKILRYRSAETALAAAERTHTAAVKEFNAARQELIDAIETACKEIR